MTARNPSPARTDNTFAAKARQISAGAKLQRLAFACILMPTLGSCRAFDASRCSAPEIIDTVMSLSKGGDNPLAAALLQTANVTFSLDAIRTVSSSSGETLCEGRLTITYPPPGRLPQEGPAPPETAEHRAQREQIGQQLATQVSEVTYKLERADDGRTYVTIIPSEADIFNEQNRQQRDQNLRDEQEQEMRADQERSIQRQEQYERDLQEQWRR